MPAARARAATRRGRCGRRWATPSSACSKNHYGRGPTEAKAWLLDDYVFVAMEGGLTRSEETLIADGKEEEVRRYCLAFQRTVSETAKRAVSELTGRRVLEYHSQIVFRPPRSVEIFVLAPAEPT